MNSSLAARLIILGLATGWLIPVLAMAGLLIGLGQSDGLVRYPGAVRLARSELRLDSLPKGRVQQHLVYHTADAWRQVFIWYVDHLKLELDRVPRPTGHCRYFTHTDAGPFIRQSLQIRLCSRAAGTMISINRQLALQGRAMSVLTWVDGKLSGCRLYNCRVFPDEFLRRFP